MSNHQGALTSAGHDIEDSAQHVQPAPDAGSERARWWLRFQELDAIDVSVCIVNWNCISLLRDCLDSLHHQPQGVRMETIVVDNASTDGAAGMVASEFPEVRLIRNETNAGFSRGNNQAAGVARGRYLLFLNNDTVVPPHTLERLLEYAAENGHVGMIGPMLRDGQGKIQVSYRRRPTMATFLHRTRLLRWTCLLRRGYHRYRRQQFDPRTPRPVEVLMGAAMLLPREVFFACGRWDEDYHFGGEDLDLCYRVGKRFPVIYHPRIEITHFGRVSTRQHIGFAETQIAIGFVRYLRKTGNSQWTLLAYKTIITLDAPLHWLTLGFQFLWRRLRGRNDKAEKTLVALRGLGKFLARGLGPFWRA